MPDATAAPQASSTQSATIADLMARAATQYGDSVAVRHKRDGRWQEVSFAQVGEIVTEIGRGLIDVGIASGDRVCILCATRPEWSYVDFGVSAAGGVVVPIYPTNSPEECEWVAGDSQARAILCENAEQVAKIEEVRDRLPDLETIIVIDPGTEPDSHISLQGLRERGRGASIAELEARSAAVSPQDPFTIIYTSGTTGPPKGCVLTHSNYRRVLDMCGSVSVLGRGEVSYLYLPLAHSFALLIQLLSFDLGGTIAYFGGDPKQIVAELQETSPSYFPSVPRIFEKIYTLATAQLAQASDDERRQFHQAVEVGARVRNLEARGEPVPEELRAPFAAAEDKLYRNVRAIFGGRVRQAVTGAAPIAQEILEFFFACGVPVLEGYGMTETATVATYSTVENYRFGTVGRALPGTEISIADDGEVLLRGDNIFRGYHRNDDASFGAVIDGWLHTGDLGSLDADGYLKITGRKKDIIITAGGKNLTPANLENDLKQSRWISQAVMHGDRRPFPVALVTLDEEEVVPWARERGLPTEIAALAGTEEVRALIQAELDEVNRRYAQVEKVKKFAILDHDLSQETGELTPTLKVKRNVVNEKYAAVLDSLY